MSRRPLSENIPTGKDQKAENKSYHLKEVVVKDLSLQCFEDEQQDNADDYDQETTFEGKRCKLPCSQQEGS